MGMKMFRYFYLRIVKIGCLITVMIIFYEIFKHHNNRMTRDLLFKQVNFSSQFDRGRMCFSLIIPDNKDILYRNKVWQYFRDGYTTTYFLGAYYDNRALEFNGSTHIRAFPILSRIGNNIPTFPDLYAQLWFNNMAHPVSIPCIKLKNASIDFWVIEGDRYGNGFYSCQLPQKMGIPVSVSFTPSQCAKPTTYFKVTVPEKKHENGINVALCMKTIFGTWRKENATYFVSLMETLKSIGISEIHIPESNLEVDAVFANVLNYYKSTGFLVQEFIPNNLIETEKYYIDTKISQSVVSAVLNHCYGQLWHKYSYVVNTDPDEILIPRNVTTLGEMMSDILSRDPKYVNQSCFVSRSAYFYTYWPDGNKDDPEHIMFLRKTFRTPVEFPALTWSTRGTGVQKAINNVRTCAMLNIHGCGYRLAEGSSFNCKHLSSDIILSHHYRGSCQMHQRCPYEYYRRIQDWTVHKYHGDHLKKNVVEVLTKAGYFDII